MLFDTLLKLSQIIFHLLILIEGSVLRDHFLYFVCQLLHKYICIHEAVLIAFIVFSCSICTQWIHPSTRLNLTLIENRRHEARVLVVLILIQIRNPSLQLNLSCLLIVFFENHALSSWSLKKCLILCSWPIELDITHHLWLLKRSNVHWIVSFQQTRSYPVAVASTIARTVLLNISHLETFFMSDNCFL